MPSWPSKYWGGLEPEPPVTVAKDADVNGDGRIGLEEALYVIHKVAGVRPQGRDR